MTKKTQLGARIFAVFMVVCGLFAIAASCLTYLGARPLLFHSRSTVEPLSASHSALIPQSGEWPLLVAKEAQVPHPPEPYSLEVAGVRDTGLLQFTVSAGSPEHARSLATWIGESFVASLRQSYTSRGFARLDSLVPQPPRVWEIPDSLPVVSRWSVATVVFQFFIPSLLIIGGATLFRARQ